MRNHVHVHGTENRYHQGCRCRRCRAAHTAYNTPRVSARAAALARLSHEFPEAYAKFYAEELTRRGLRSRREGARV